MRLTWLYLRSRRTGHALVALVTVAMLGWWWANTMLYVPAFRGSNVLYTPVLFFIPSLSAAVVTATARSPFGETERTVSRPLAPLRGGHLTGLLLIALATLLLAALEWQYKGAALILSRNLAGFAGIAFISAVLIGSRLAWVAPVTFGFVTHQFGRNEASQVDWWAWPLQPATHIAALLGALGLLVVGLLIVALLGTRESAGETE